MLICELFVRERERRRKGKGRKEVKGWEDEKKKFDESLKKECYDPFFKLLICVTS